MRLGLWLQAKIDARLMQDSLIQQQINEKEQGSRRTKLGVGHMVCARLECRRKGDVIGEEAATKKQVGDEWVRLSLENHKLAEPKKGWSHTSIWVTGTENRRRGRGKTSEEAIMVDSNITCDARRV